VLRLSDEKQIIINIQEFSNAVVVQYSMDNLQVNQQFSFIEDSDGAIVAMALDLSVVNLSAEAVDSQLRLIFDTTLGEQRANHFSTVRASGISREYGFSPNSDEPWILSSNGDYGLLFTLSGSGASAPREVVAANWKRLSEAPWDYEIQESRNFNLLPFSINDSAVGLFYGPERIAAQDTASYRLYLSFHDSRRSPSDVAAAIRSGSAAIMISEAQQPLEIASPDSASDAGESVLPEAASFTPEQVRTIAPYIQDLETIDALIDQIDSLLGSRTTLAPEEVRALQDILSTIRDNLPD
jgi:hypothetical protein